MDAYLEGTKVNFYDYVAGKQYESSDIDGFLVMMASYYIGKVITVVTNDGILSTDHINHDVVIVHLGGQTFYDTDIGNNFSHLR